MISAEAVSYPRPVSRQAYDVFALEDPVSARLLVKLGRVKVIDDDQKNEVNKNVIKN